MIELNSILHGDCLEILRTIPDEIVDCCVTSPPYYGLRDYGVDGQIGLEETPEMYVEKMVQVFREVKRVLKPEGTLWLNLGDSYAGGKTGRTDQESLANYIDNNGNKSGGRPERYGETGRQRPVVKGLKPKDLIGIPWLVAFALRSDGYYLRQDIIWSKPNPMPESVTDRCTKAHEYIFLLSKSAKYYFDQEAIKQPVANASIIRLSQQLENQTGSTRVPGKSNGNMKAVGPGRKPRPDDNRGGNQGTERGIPAMAIDGRGVNGHSGYYNQNGELIGGGMANKRSVWTVTTKPFKEAHFATFPEDLIVDCIKAGCPENGIVLDPFAGTNTTGIVAKKLDRNFISIELNSGYIEIAEKRTLNEIGLFL